LTQPPGDHAASDRRLFWWASGFIGVWRELKRFLGIVSADPALIGLAGAPYQSNLFRDCLTLIIPSDTLWTMPEPIVGGFLRSIPVPGSPEQK